MRYKMFSSSIKMSEYINELTVRWTGKTLSLDEVITEASLREKEWQATLRNLWMECHPEAREKFDQLSQAWNGYLIWAGGEQVGADVSQVQAEWERVNKTTPEALFAEYSSFADSLGWFDLKEEISTQYENLNKSSPVRKHVRA